MNILATGDWHLGAMRESLGPERLADQEAVLDSIYDLVCEERPDVFLLAGDPFERRTPSPDELAVFSRFVRKLRAEPCASLAIVGNHCVSASSATTALELFADSIDVHREPGIWRSGDLSVVTLPWAPVSRLVASRGGGDRDETNQEAAALLIETARGLRASPDLGDGPAVLLLHWSVSGAALPSGLPIDMAREVILPLYDLEALGFDAVIAGHIHRTQRLGSLIGYGPMLYVGSPMPLSFGEAGQPHGVTVLEWNTARGAFGETFLPIESRRFLTVDVDLTMPADEAFDLDEGDHLAAAISEHFPLDGAIVKLRYRATEEQHRRIDHGALKTLCLDAGASRVYAIQAEIVREVRARAEGLDESLGEQDALAMYLASQEINGAVAERMGERLGAYLTEARA